VHFSNIRVLVAEDEALVSMLIEAELTDAGYSLIGPFTNCKAALDWLANDTPDLGILDPGLRDGPCTEVALEMRRRNVPFLVLSGSMPEALPQELRQAPRIMKPSGLEMLASALAALREERCRSPNAPSDIPKGAS